jgi:hypothetical protein
MTDEASKYNGPHKIRLNRNNLNIGLVRHLERVVGISSGEFIVVQAGDDLSASHRTTELVKAWKYPTPVDLVCSDVSIIDEMGAVVREGWDSPIGYRLSLDEAISKGSCYALGCTCGYSRALFGKYYPMNEHVFQEDNVLPFRALLNKGVRVLESRLVSYREHSISISKTQLPVNVANIDKKRQHKFELNQWGIVCDMLSAWDQSAMPHDNRWARLKQLERHKWYMQACTSSSTLKIVLLVFKGLMDGLTVRNCMGLIYRNISNKF